MKVYRNGKKVYICPKCKQEVYSVPRKYIAGEWLEMCRTCWEEVKE